MNIVIKMRFTQYVLYATIGKYKLIINYIINYEWKPEIIWLFTLMKFKEL